MCHTDLNEFKIWNWNHSITENQANNLVAQGYKELSSIAHNYGKYFPNLFNGPYDDTNFHFRHTSTERTRSSFRAFVNELFGENAHQNIKNAESPKNQPDLLLKAYKNCPLWREQKKLLKQSNSEITRFENSVIFSKLIEEIKLRFGFDGILQKEQIKDIYDICRYEQAWHINKTSIWCSVSKNPFNVNIFLIIPIVFTFVSFIPQLFTPSQMRILEYQRDLNYFYKSSHGSKSNKFIQCFAMEDMLNRLESDISPKTTVYFSHSASIQLFLTSLGALKDDIDLKADNYFERLNRKWKTSAISPFAANIAIVRYDCPFEKRNYVKFFLNEKLLYFDWCDSGMCDWLDVRNKYSYYLHKKCEHVFCQK